MLGSQLENPCPTANIAIPPSATAHTEALRHTGWTAPAESSIAGDSTAAAGGRCSRSISPVATSQTAATAPPNSP